jgi:predicted transcriptional regulator of viral defense system
MPGARYTQIAERAAETFGYLTSEDAHVLGVRMGTLNALARRGQLERVGHGIYRVPLIPPSRLDQYMPGDAVARSPRSHLPRVGARPLRAQ